MSYLHIFDSRGREVACILTATPSRTARSWIRQNAVQGAFWYAAKAVLKG